MDPADLAIAHVEPPAVEAGKVAIDVEAIGCNWSDTLIVRGKYQVKPDFPFSPGGEVAGIVAELGEGVEGFEVGDRVMAYVEYGGYAQRVNARPDATFPIPDRMPFDEAAAIPIVYGTSYLALVPRGRLKAGQTVLVTAAAGGVGLASIQIAKALDGRVIALAGGAEKLEVVRNAGADVAIDYREGNWIERVREETGGRGADVVIENVGGEIFDGCTRCIAWGGRIVVVGFSSGEIPLVKANRVLLKHISLVGVHFGPMVNNDPEGLAVCFRELMRLHESGRLTPVIWKTYPLESAAEALGALADRKSFGKIILTL
ncbi:MAG: NADPH:quinone oxidoreductase family protein [bacterium]|nr:NADPH:quinone oxidoreductase family protein [bacterium]MCP5043744.1 NADPH:quinone oxidoreductase family protein [bacterium]